MNATVHVTLPSPSGTLLSTQVPNGVPPEGAGSLSDPIGQAVQTAITKAGLAIEGAATLRDAFAPHFQSLHALTEKARDIKPEDARGARRLRLEMREVRIAADKTREQLKEDGLRRGNAIQGIFNVLKYQVVPMEEALEQIERAEEIREANAKAALQQARMEELRPYVDPSLTASLDLTMAEALWLPFLAGTKASHEAKIAHAAKVEADRIEREKQEAEGKAKREADAAAERLRMQEENARLAKVAAEERAKREQQEGEAAQARAESDAKAKAAKDEADRVAKVEREKREAAERELARIAQEKAEKERADAAAAKKAKAAPDKEKLVLLAKQIRVIHVPTLNSEGGKELAARITEQAVKFAAWVEAEAGKL